MLSELAKPLMAAVFVFAAMAAQASAQEVAPADVKIADYAISDPLTGSAGDAVAGAKTFADRGLGNCLACHAVSALETEQFHGNVGPALDGVADRWNAEELRAIVVDAKQIFSEETVMPAFYSLDYGITPRKDLVGKTILTAQQVEDVVAYLATLKE
jgi:L-cysteine S-thiosulfotransferase